MTRFARAKGSKSSNERLPEQATSWTTMKNDLQQSKADAELEKQREKINEIRQRKYDNFVEEAESKIEKKWVEFPGDTKTHQSPMKRKSKSPAKLVKEECVPTEKIDELIQTDANSDTGLHYFESLLNKKRKFKKANDDDAPTKETESKVKTDLVEFSDQSPKKKKKKKSKSPAKLVNEQPDAKIDREVDNFESPLKKKKFKTENDDNIPKEMAAEIIPKLHVKSKNKKEKINAINRGQAPKNAKVPNKEYKRRKEIKPKVVMLNGIEETLVHFQGFPIRKTDADHLVNLRKTMRDMGISSPEIERALFTLRRKSERATSRLLRQICYQCRKTGHLLSECPEVSNNASPIETVGSGICYKCGSTEHSHLKCREKKGYTFATCFICREQGHIARECPDNSRGLYPNGGSCKLCGDVTHLKKDCPIAKQENLSNELVVGTIAQTDDIESLDNAPKAPKIRGATQKLVVF